MRFGENVSGVTVTLMWTAQYMIAVQIYRGLSIMKVVQKSCALWNYEQIPGNITIYNI